MNQNRPNGLAMLHINKDIDVTSEEILDIFLEKTNKTFSRIYN